MCARGVEGFSICTCDYSVRGLNLYFSLVIIVAPYFLRRSITCVYSRQDLAPRLIVSKAQKNNSDASESVLVCVLHSTRKTCKMNRHSLILSDEQREDLVSAIPSVCSAKSNSKRSAYLIVFMSSSVTMIYRKFRTRKERVFEELM